MTNTRKHSRITDDLPPEIKRAVDRLLLEENVTYEDIKTFLSGKGFDISKSSIGRYGQDFLNSYRRLRTIEDQSRTLVSEAGEGMILEEAAAKIFAQKIVEIQLSPDFKLKDFNRLIGDFARLQSSSVQRERFKNETRDRVKKAVEKIEEKTKKTGISQETLDIVKREIYGIV